MKQTSVVKMECGHHRRKQHKYLKKKKTEAYKGCVKVTGKKRDNYVSLIQNRAMGIKNY